MGNKLKNSSAATTIVSVHSDNSDSHSHRISRVNEDEFATEERTHIFYSRVGRYLVSAVAPSRTTNQDSLNPSHER